MDLKAVEKIYVRQLKEIYSVEKQLLGILPGIIKMISSKELKVALKFHFDQTRIHTERMRKIFRQFNNYKPGDESCDPIKGLVRELEDLIEDANHSISLDAEVILIFQKIEHYEIACYSSLITYARVLGHSQSCEMLQESLDEEFEADNKLEKLNEEIINTVLMKHA